MPVRFPTPSFLFFCCPPLLCQIFSVRLTLGDQYWEAQGPSIKKAQHSAAASALGETTLPKPTLRTSRNTNRIPSGFLQSFCLLTLCGGNFKALFHHFVVFYSRWHDTYHGVKRTMYEIREKTNLQTNRPISGDETPKFPLQYPEPGTLPALYATVRESSSIFLWFCYGWKNSFPVPPQVLLLISSSWTNFVPYGAFCWRPTVYWKGTDKTVCQKRCRSQGLESIAQRGNISTGFSGKGSNLCASSIQ